MHRRDPQCDLSVSAAGLSQCASLAVPSRSCRHRHAAQRTRMGVGSSRRRGSLPLQQLHTAVSQPSPQPFQVGTCVLMGAVGAVHVPVDCAWQWV